MLLNNADYPRPFLKPHLKREKRNRPRHGVKCKNNRNYDCPKSDFHAWCAHRYAIAADA